MSLDLSELPVEVPMSEAPIEVPLREEPGDEYYKWPRSLEED
jgi:hypothetical protein